VIECYRIPWNLLEISTILSEGASLTLEKVVFALFAFVVIVCSMDVIGITAF
jgi:hypothetical protein